MEEWRPVPGYEDKYEVSNHGRIRTVAKLLSLQTINGYTTVGLWRGNNGRTTYVHRLVASVFLEPAVGRDYVNHKNADRQDNRPANLEWCTQKENVEHARALGLSPNPPRLIGEQCSHSKLQEVQVREIFRRYNAGERVKEIAADYGITRPLVSAIGLGKAWRHLGLVPTRISIRSKSLSTPSERRVV